MKIIRLQTQGFKRVVAVDLTPSDPLVEVRGNNAEGKSSLLDSIMAALGGAEAAPVKPIKTGEEFSAIRVTLGDGEPDIIVEKYFDDVGEKLKVTSADGAEYKAGQTKIADLLGRMTFDPLAFARMPAKDQAAELRRLVPLSVDLDELAAQDRADVTARRDVNRDAKALKARIEAIPVETDLPEEKPDLDALTKTLANAAEINGAIERERMSRNERRRVIEDRLAKVGELTAEIGRLEDRIATIRDEIAMLDKGTAERLAELEALPPLDEPVDTTAASTAIADARQIINRFARKETRDSLVAEFDALKVKSEGFTKALEDRAALRAKALAEAKMPIGGLTFARLCDIVPTEESEDLIVAYNGEPFSQASGAEQLRVSMRLAMAANPKLRVMLIKDGSLLDPNGLALVRDMAADGDYQVWLESVGEGDGSGIIMEAGKVRGADEPERIDPPKRRQTSRPLTDKEKADMADPAKGSDPIPDGLAIDRKTGETVIVEDAPIKRQRPRAMTEFTSAAPAASPSPAKPQGGLFGDE